MSASHAMINVSLRGAFFPSHAFSFNIGNKKGPNLKQNSQVFITRLSRDQSEIY